MEYSNQNADVATQDFFSRFCFYIKAVNEDASKLDLALTKLNSFLESNQKENKISISTPNQTQINGSKVSVFWL